LPNVSPKKINR